MNKLMKIACFAAGFSLLLVGTGLLIVPTGKAQDAPDEIEQFSEELEKSGDMLEERYRARSENIILKRDFAEVLLERQEKILNETESTEKESRLSLATFELFLAQSRLITEELKLWQVERMIEIQSILDSEEAGGAIEFYLDELAERREQTNSEIFELADRYRPYITDPEVNSQFELYLTDGLRQSAD